MPGTLCTPVPAAPRSPTPQGTEAAVATRERLGQGFPGSGESGRPGISSSTGSMADEAGFELKTGSSPIEGQGGRSGSLGLQDQLPRWAELERSGSWSETRAQRQRASAELPHFPVGSPGTPCPVPCVYGLLKRAWEPCERERAAGHGEPRDPFGPGGLSTQPSIPAFTRTLLTNRYHVPALRPRVPFLLRPSFFPPISLRRSLVTVGTTWTPWSRRRALGCGHTEVPVLKRAAGFEARC